VARFLWAAVARRAGKSKRADHGPPLAAQPVCRPGKPAAIKYRVERRAGAACAARAAANNASSEQHHTPGPTLVPQSGTGLLMALYRIERALVRSPIGLWPPAFRAASRATTPGNAGRSKRRAMKRRIEVVSYCV
jgi:hypothetical protein